MIHWFPIYAFLGPILFWDDLAPAARSLNAFDVKMSVVNLLIPIYTLMGSTYDGTLLTLPLAMGFSAWRCSRAVQQSRAS